MDSNFGVGLGSFLSKFGAGLQSREANSMRVFSAIAQEKIKQAGVQALATKQIMLEKSKEDNIKKKSFYDAFRVWYNASENNNKSTKEVSDQYNTLYKIYFPDGISQNQQVQETNSPVEDNTDYSYIYKVPKEIMAQRLEDSYRRDKIDSMVRQQMKDKEEQKQIEKDIKQKQQWTEEAKKLEIEYQKQKELNNKKVITKIIMDSTK